MGATTGTALATPRWSTKVRRQSQASAENLCPPSQPYAIVRTLVLPLHSALLCAHVVDRYPPPSHNHHLGCLGGKIATRPTRERADRRTGTSRPSSARAGCHVSKSPVALFGNEGWAAPPSFAASLRLSCGAQPLSRRRAAIVSRRPHAPALAHHRGEGSTTKVGPFRGKTAKVPTWADPDQIR